MGWTIATLALGAICTMRRAYGIATVSTPDEASAAACLPGLSLAASAICDLKKINAFISIVIATLHSLMQRDSCV